MNRSPESGSGEPRPLLADEAEAVAVLFRSTAAKLFPSALFMTQGDRARAEDLIQQAFHAAINAWTTVGLMDPRRQQAWLYTVLRHKAIDTRRASAREHLVPGLDFDQLRAAQDIPHQVLCREELDRTLKLVIMMPPVRHRVMVLYVLEGLPIKEIADLLGIAQSTVRGHLKAARDTLSQEIGLPFPSAKDHRPGDTPPREGLRP